MHKLIAAAPDKVVVADVPRPDCGPRGVLVKAVRSLVSPGSELNRIRRLPGDRDSKWPNHDLGYATSGVVVEVGAEVDTFQVGQRVATMQHHQEYVVSPAVGDDIRSPLPLPDDIEWDRAPFVLWGRSCYNWTMKADIRPGETVAVVGAGLVGLLMIMWARLRGPAQVIAVDLAPSRLRLASAAGAEHLVCPAEGDPVEAVRALTHGKMAQCTIHCAAGAHVEAFELSQRITATGGRVVLLGIHSEHLTILRHEFLNKDLLGGGTDYDYSPELQLQAMKLLQAGKLPVERIVTHNVPYTMAPEIYDMLNFRSHEAGAVLLRWDMD
ncbi:MAG: zinc-binding dehydrogenase [Armatimonadetes bacterium]|nr:zinc-binding dehydrogenase [Armatimonadota bacterium]